MKHHHSRVSLTENKIEKLNQGAELADEYGAEGIGSCPFLKVGQVFYADWECTENLDFE